MELNKHRLAADRISQSTYKHFQNHLISQKQNDSARKKFKTLSAILETVRTRGFKFVFEGVSECFLPIFNLKNTILGLISDVFKSRGSGTGVRGSKFKSHPDTPKPISDAQALRAESVAEKIFRRCLRNFLSFSCPIEWHMIWTFNSRFRKIEIFAMTFLQLNNQYMRICIFIFRC